MNQIRFDFLTSPIKDLTSHNHLIIIFCSTQQRPRTRQDVSFMKTLEVRPPLSSAVGSGRGYWQQSDIGLTFFWQQSDELLNVMHLQHMLSFGSISLRGKAKCLGIFLYRVTELFLKNQKEYILHPRCREKKKS